MSEITGHQTCVIKGPFKFCVEQCLNEQEKGFEIEKVNRKIDWPFFWRLKYKVKMRKYFMFGENGVVAHVPKKIDIKEFL